MSTEQARADVLRLAHRQGSVASRRQAYAVGMTRAALRAQIAAKRWQKTGRQTFAVHNAELSAEGTWWRAVLEVGPKAALDGVSSLLAAGLEHYEERLVHVIAPKSARPRHPTGVAVHESRRFCEEDIAVDDGVRRVRSAVAAVHGALWARSDRQAVLILAMTVQQKLAAPMDIADALGVVRRHRRRALLRQALMDIGGGSESMGEIDVLAGIRRRGLPEPTRQSMRRLSGGTAFLDIDWEDWSLVLELDGTQHADPAHRLSDTVRDLEIVAGGKTVLRIPMIAWRLDEEAILDRLTAVFISRGWSAAA